MYEHMFAMGEPMKKSTAVPLPPGRLGRVIDEVVASVSTWPTQYQRSVDVHADTSLASVPQKPQSERGPSSGQPKSRS